MYSIKHNTKVEASIEDTFAWHEHEGSFRRLMPPWLVAEEIRADKTLQEGSQRIFRFPLNPLLPLKMKWIAEHTEYNPPKRFSEIMVKGPFWYWKHNHDFKFNNGITTITDDVTYQVPFGRLGNFVDNILGGLLVKNELKRMFKSREIRLQRDIKIHSQYYHIPRKRVLIAGSSGLIGTQLVAFFDTGGHDVWRLVRRPIKEGHKEIQWNPETGELDGDSIEGFDIVIHLGGEGIGDKRWSIKRKKQIVDSRRLSTTLLSDTLSRLKSKPDVLIVASAIGFYGSRDDEELTEESKQGEGFLTDTVISWESFADSAKEAGIRVVNTRNGIVLSGAGGALGRMLLPWKIGGGGPIGGGKQWMSWISMDDEIYAIHHLAMNPNSEGIYNMTSPNPSRQKSFAKILGKVLRRPAIAPIPKFSMRLLFGELADPLLIEGQRVIPKRLLESGYSFVHTDLESALRDSLGIWKDL